MRTLVWLIFGLSSVLYFSCKPSNKSKPSENCILSGINQSGIFTGKIIHDQSRAVTLSLANQM